MNKLHTTEVNVQVIISLLKAHGIRKVIASPGATNITFVGSIQKDPFFTVYSSVDERSAAYMACGLAEESGEPVVLSCTGATASRNYVPGLTEAYYRKLPVLAVTSTQPISRVGHHIAQVIDRSSLQNDIVKLSVLLPFVKDEDDLWDCEIKVNQAILELKRNGGGPVHINLPTNYTLPFVNKLMPKYRVIDRIQGTDSLPPLLGKIAIFVGSHKKWTSSEVQTVENFCSTNNAVVFCDHTSSYKGKYRLLFSLVAAQELLDKSEYKPDILIHIGEVSGDYSSATIVGEEVWRVSEDGEIRDTFRKLRYVFEMSEEKFFTEYSGGTQRDDSYFEACSTALDKIRQNIPELPFSNIWVASELSGNIPNNSVVHFGILNTLRSWNFFEVPSSVTTASNVGGFGIDGVLSSLVGASLDKSNKLFFCILGDLAFFYDMNILGNRHLGNNLRILIINNGKGTEFKQYNHHAAYFKDEADDFMAAADHFGKKSPTLVKNYAENLGFEYLTASNKEDFKSVYERFISLDVTSKPMLFEIFTDSKEESDALKVIQTIEKDNKSKLKSITKKILGKNGISLAKKILKS
ncbi:2-succinyl-5-enolpyruvyl-6-hydroxy-3-cyclohexene-1-carboxylate synthase [Photobacterium piscicola]|uniref:2-succinyl-5-enolpyruvyl-6-hydroxy-3-cyclohexene-1-carboxylate synthase n=1 Tax=Photobacterium piscicola TaxID=1378299 RepID=A0A1T5I1W4_9GAMM|nr:thiamine pyrophosphate-binding protein [Photobacterium piscicola]SKC33053.1 2-succinyl-5-enolpyruvyl-6-hydroxy-3-cyclohexene-1-carboxylate synthase [Photobacterium piscicola]